MNIEIVIKNNEKVLLRADENNYELCRVKHHADKDTGEIVEEWVPEKYFATVGQALNRVIDMKVRASEARTLAELKAAIKSAQAEVCGLWATNQKEAQ